MMLLLKASASTHPVVQGSTPARQAPVLLTEKRLRRNPGEPDAEQSASSEYKKPRLTWRGMVIQIENPAGSVRRGRNRHGVTWEQRMAFDYGEFVGTKGVDGDPVDVFLGPSPDAPYVYVVHQRRVNDWAEYDEDKCMVGFDTIDDAAAAFLQCYTDPRFLGPITVLPVAEFIEKLMATREKPAMIKSVLITKAHVGAYMRGGKLVNLGGYENKGARGVPTPGQMPLILTRQDHGEAALRSQFDAHGDGFELRNEDGKRWALLMPDASHPGKYRYQVFTADGFGHHYTFDSRAEAFEHAVSEGYSSADVGALERLIVEPAWSAGMERQAAEGVTNGEVVAKALQVVRRRPPRRLLLTT